MSSYLFDSIQWYDKETGGVLYELYLECMNKYHFSKELVEVIKSCPRPGSVEIEQNMIFMYGDLEVTFDKWPNHPVRIICNSSQMPYRTHTGREFDLMMKKMKPLSVFRYVKPNSSQAIFLDRYFDVEVSRGNLVSFIESEDTDRSDGSSSIKMYALLEEIWRIEAYKLLILSSKFSSWTNALEFMQGSLLGFSEIQNRIWLKNLELKGHRWGLQAMYVPLDKDRLNLIYDSGCRSLSILKDDQLYVYFPQQEVAKYQLREVFSSLGYLHFAKLYIPLIKVMNHNVELVDIGDIKFQKFSFKNGGVQELNMILDGLIEIN